MSIVTTAFRGAYDLAFQISPIILKGGSVSSAQGGMLPIIGLLSEIAGFAQAAATNGIAVEDFPFRFVPIPGGTIIQQGHVVALPGQAPGNRHGIGRAIQCHGRLKGRRSVGVGEERDERRHSGELRNLFTAPYIPAMADAAPSVGWPTAAFEPPQADEVMTDPPPTFCSKEFSAEDADCRVTSGL